MNNTTQHTPGPWHVGHQDTQSVRADGLLVATMACQRKEWQANARLIAAAPELLDALELMLFSPNNPVAIREANAAIKKAKGIV